MKRYKLLTVLLIALMVVILAACGGGDTTTKGFNPDAYASGKQAVRIVEDYAAGNITIEECFNEFVPLLDYLDTIEAAEAEQETTTQIKEYVNALAYDLTLNEDYSDNLTGLKELLGV